MGTPDFAVPSLKALVESGFNVVAVVTAPDRPAGRGLQLKTSAVKDYAVNQGLPVLQPEKLKRPEFIETLTSYKADLQVVVAFRMLPEIVWNMPQLGTLNLHASLLPDYRGAAPINHAIINGEKETGATTFFLKHAIDTGDIIMQRRIAIDENETAGSLHDKLMVIGADLVVDTVTKIQDGNAQSTPQPMGKGKEAPKIFPENCVIDWNLEAIEIERFIRGLSPYPTAKTELDGKQLKIYASEISDLEKDGSPGDSFIDYEQKKLLFRSRDAWLSILDLQLQGKKRMLVEDFLRGYRK